MTDAALSQLAVCAVIAAGVACGLVWGRLSESLVIPEILRMLTTPLWTGLLGLVFGSPLAYVFFGSKIRNSPHDVGLGTVALSCLRLAPSWECQASSAGPWDTDNPSRNATLR